MARTHGLSSTYNSGCHCEACKAAIAKYRAERRERGLDLRKKPTKQPRKAAA